ncbi:hypothetical protein CPB86DRAFT_561639 [Serendipita vermifera]|nr:hypothetical protein CPB86DRAFT_561639 [Serendipita vermifera]
MHFRDSTVTTRYLLPLEIWMEIFACIMISPLLSSLNDDLLHNTRLLDHDCDNFQLADQQTRVRLQLDCRAWNETIRRLPLRPSCWHGSRWPAYWPPSVSRIEFNPYPGDKCTKKICNCGLQRISIGSAPIEYSIEAFVERGEGWIGIGPLLVSFPNLRLLSLKRGCNRKHNIGVIATSTILCNLTHLRLPPLWTHSPEYEADFPLQFTRIHTLSIDRFEETEYIRSLISRHGSFPTGYHLCFSDWIMPNLKNLEIIGSNASSGNYQILYNSQIGMLLQKIGPILQGFAYLNLETSCHGRVPVNLPIGVWKYCSQLKMLHGYLTEITAVMPFLATQSLINAIISDFKMTYLKSGVIGGENPGNPSTCLFIPL